MACSAKLPPPSTTPSVLLPVTSVFCERRQESDSPPPTSFAHDIPLSLGQRRPSGREQAPSLSRTREPLHRAFRWCPGIRPGRRFRSENIANRKTAAASFSANWIGWLKARIQARVRQGGHDVPEVDILRRFVRGWDNFERGYAPLADAWSVIDDAIVPCKVMRAFP